MNLSFNKYMFIACGSTALANLALADYPQPIPLQQSIKIKCEFSLKDASDNDLCQDKAEMFLDFYGHKESITMEKCKDSGYSIKIIAVKELVGQETVRMKSINLVKAMSQVEPLFVEEKINELPAKNIKLADHNPEQGVTSTCELTWE